MSHPHASPEFERAGTVVDARGVRRSFGDRAVLAGVDLTIQHGEFVAMLGRSGSGKSTLLRILGTLDTADDGSVRVPARRATVFQEASLLPWKRVIDNVIIGLKASQARDIGRAALAEVGLQDQERSWPATLSGGEAQRVALARALVREPDLLLLDEPFGALDALTRIKMHSLLQELCVRHQPAVLLVTHDVDEAVLLADRVVVLADGRIIRNLEIPLSRPRRREGAAFAALRAELLRDLGVEEIPLSNDELHDSEGAPSSATPLALARPEQLNHQSLEVSVR